MCQKRQVALIEKLIFSICKLNTVSQTDKGEFQQQVSSKTNTIGT